MTPSGYRIIKQESSKIESLNDLSFLLTTIRCMEFGSDCTYPITTKQLGYFANKKDYQRHYSIFKISKKNGEYREICAPIKGLKIIQHCINKLLQSAFQPKSCTFGFILHRSIINNAQCHINQRYILNVDIKDFFSHIYYKSIYEKLLLPPFNYNSKIAKIIANICCFSKKPYTGYLPQGAPTSPILSNIVCKDLDQKLYDFSQRHNLIYSRYADDITFSCTDDKFYGNTLLFKELNSIIKSENFRLNHKKTRIQKKGHRQTVTGITISEKINVSKNYIKELRSILHNWEIFGYDIANKIFTHHYCLNHPDYILKENSGTLMESVVFGKLNFLSMVKGSKDSTYIKLLSRYNALVNPHTSVHKVVNIQTTDFVKILKEAVKQFGVENIESTQFINALKDYHAFNNKKAYELILLEMIRHKWISKLQLCNDYPIESAKIKSILVHRCGFQDIYVNDVINSISSIVCPDGLIINNLQNQYGPLQIYDISFANCDNGIIDDFRDDLYDYKMRYLTPRIYYNELQNFPQEIKLKIRIFNPDSTSFRRGKDSPSDCSYTTVLTTTGTYAQGCAQDLPGWGNADTSVYAAGTYKIEIWNNDIKLFSKNFFIKENDKYTKLRELYGIINIKDVLLSNTTKDGPILTDNGNTSNSTDIRYLTPTICFDELNAKPIPLELKIKIYDPDMGIKTGMESPKGFSYTYSFISPGKYAANQKRILPGFSNNERSNYPRGIYHIQIWHKSDLLFTKRFEIE